MRNSSWLGQGCSGLCAQALAFTDILVSNSFQEPKLVGISFLERFQKSFETSLLRSIHCWLSQGYCRNWAVIDALATRLVTPLITKYPEILSELMRWGQSNDLWQRRTAVVGLVKLARKGQHLDAAYDLAEGLLGDKEDLIQKAVGWLLKEAGKTDSARLESF
ncbi:DNA alkylation repair protein [bacterium]|nr:DNA alkylation repair protein [bacterium]